MVEVTEADRCLICGETLAMHNRGTGLPTCRHIAVPTFKSAATHRIEAAKAERDRLRELPDEVVKAAMDRANAMARQTLEGAFRIVAIALAEALESQP